MTAPLPAAESFPASEPAFVAAGNHDITELTTHVCVSGGRIIGSVRLNAHQDIFCRAPEQARDIARAFTECAALMEAKAREAAPEDVPRPGGSMEGPEVRQTDAPGHAVKPSAGPGHPLLVACTCPDPATCLASCTRCEGRDGCYQEVQAP